MCQIDWGALGTWVASLVALGIALEDKFYRRTRARSERLALAALIRADLALALFHLQKLATEIAADHDAAVRGISDALVFDSEQNRAEITRHGALIDVPAIHAAADRLYVFDADTAKTLAEVVTSLRALKLGIETMTAPLPEFDIFANFMHVLRISVEESKKKMTAAHAQLSRLH